MKAAFILAAALTVFSTFNSQAQVLTSYTNCQAYTDCYTPYGAYNGRISCQVYGSSYVYGAGNTSNACTWFVRPYHSVQCTGFAQTRDVYGNFVWGWQNFVQACPGAY